MSAGIKQAASQIIGLGETDSEDVEASDGKKSLLGGFDLKGLMTKKEKVPA